MKNTFALLAALLFLLPTAARDFPKNERGSFSALHQSRTAGFLENKGQVKDFDGLLHPEVRFLLERQNLEVFLLEHGIAYQFKKINFGGQIAQQKDIDLHGSVSIETFRMDMVLIGAKSHPLVTAEDKSKDYVNYYNHGALNVHHYQKVIYHDVYPGIDWVLRLEGESMKHEFIVHPLADASQIKMEFRGQEGIGLNPDGSFELRNSLGRIFESRPLSFQLHEEIPTKFVLTGNTLTFQLEEYNHKLPLVIDPSMLWGTYYGGSGEDVGRDCVADLNGDVYLSGQTGSSGAIASLGHQNNLSGNTDGFLAKFDGTGLRLWASYYGGTSTEYSVSCAVDPGGDVYIAGITNSAGNISSGGHQNTYGGGGDAFLVKFSSAGTRLWATYYGGTGNEAAFGCATDASGEVYICGRTTSSGSISASGHQNAYGGSGDAFLVKFNGFGQRLWATYYGGFSSETGWGVCTDSPGNVYLVGNTASGNGIGAGGHQNFFAGGASDAFLVKFDAGGNRQWGTYYGGTSNDSGVGCTTDGSGNVFITGGTNSSGGISHLGFQSNLSPFGLVDAYLAKFNPSGVRQWGTYYGDLPDDLGYACAADAAGNVYLVGSTMSSTNIAMNGYQDNFGGGIDAFIVKFDAFCTRLWGTYLGDQSFEEAQACAMNFSGDIFIAGSTTSTQGLFGFGHQGFSGGGRDAFVAKFCTGLAPNPPTAIIGPSVVCLGRTYTYSVINDPAATSYTWTIPFAWSGSSTTNSIVVSVSPFSNPTGALMVAATGSCGTSENQGLIVQVEQTPSLNVVASESVYCVGMTVTLSASGASSFTWSNGSTGPSQTVSPFTTTTYSVIGTTGASCTNSATYTIQPSSISAFNYSVNGMVANLSVQNSNCSSFLWDYGNGTGSSINPNPVVTYATPGTYGVCLKCNGYPNGCVSCINITVPGNMSGGVGLTAITTRSLPVIFPNPSSAEFNFESDAEGRIYVYNSVGQLVHEQELSIGLNSIDLSGSGSGLYFIRIDIAGGSSMVSVLKDP